MNSGCFFSVCTTALIANTVSVSFAPCFSYVGANFFRNSFKPVMSASSNCVTRGTAAHEALIRRAIVWRNWLTGFFKIGPNFAKSVRAGAGTSFGAPAVCKFWMYARKSSTVMRPP